MTVDRRVFLQSGLAAAIVPKAAAAPAPKIPELARRLLGENAGRVDNNDSVGIIDFTQPSRVPRFHVVDMIDGSVASCLTAHGRGSDPRHTGFLERFSNDKGSNATSSGAYRTGSLYDGKYGRAMRLVGLDAENNNAEARAIVIHSAWYVSDLMIERYGKLGRSEGCFTMRESDLKPLFDRLGPGRLLYAGRFDGHSR